MDAEATFSTPAGPPRTIFAARLDPKGRIKLSPPLEAYLRSFSEDRVFVTSIDNRTVQIYPLAVWAEHDQILTSYNKNPQLAADLAFLAYDNGSDCRLDKQGRVLIPQELRRRLGMVSPQVWFNCFKGVIQIFGEEIYRERQARAVGGLDEKLLTMQQEGLR